MERSRETEARSIQLWLKLFLLLFYYTVARLWIEARERTTRACAQLKKKKNSSRAQLVESLETYVGRSLRMNVKSVLKIHFPRRYIATGRDKKRGCFYSASNYPVLLIPNRGAGSGWKIIQRESPITMYGWSVLTLAAPSFAETCGKMSGNGREVAREIRERRKIPAKVENGATYTWHCTDPNSSVQRIYFRALHSDV